MKSITIIALSLLVLSACGSKKAETAEVEEVKKETYNLLTDSKEIIDEAKMAAETLEKSGEKTKNELESLLD